MNIQIASHVATYPVICAVAVGFLHNCIASAEETKTPDPELVQIVDEFDGSKPDLLERKRYSYQDRASGADQADPGKLSIHEQDGVLTVNASFPSDPSSGGMVKLYWGAWSDLGNPDLPTLIDIGKYPIIEIRTRLVEGTDASVNLFYSFQSDPPVSRENSYTYSVVRVGDPKDKTKWGVHRFKVLKTPAVSRIMGLLLRIDNKAGPVKLEIDWIRARTEEEDL